MAGKAHFWIDNHLFTAAGGVSTLEYAFVLVAANGKFLYRSPYYASKKKAIEHAKRFKIIVRSAAVPKV